MESAAPWEVIKLHFILNAVNCVAKWASRIDGGSVAPSHRLGWNNYCVISKHHSGMNNHLQSLLLWCGNKRWLVCQIQAMITTITFNNGSICFMPLCFGYWFFFPHQGEQISNESHGGKDDDGWGPLRKRKAGIWSAGNSTGWGSSAWQRSSSPLPHTSVGLFFLFPPMTQNTWSKEQWRTYWSYKHRSKLWNVVFMMSPLEKDLLLTKNDLRLWTLLDGGSLSLTFISSAF